MQEGILIKNKRILYVFILLLFIIFIWRSFFIYLREDKACSGCKETSKFTDTKIKNYEFCDSCSIEMLAVWSYWKNGQVYPKAREK